MSAAAPARLRGVRLSPASPRAWIPLLAVAGLLALYLGALRTGFLNDDYLFLEDARTRGVSAAWSAQGPLANYFRPISRAVFFGLLSPLAGGHAVLFHLASFALFLLALSLLWELLRAFAPVPGAAAGALYFALLPLQRVNLTWISCCQDLLALAGTLGSLAAFRRGRDRAALALYLAAALSKESALPLPALLFFWDWRLEGRGAAGALRRVAPFSLAALAWALGEAWLRHASAAPQALMLTAGSAAAGGVHLVQSLLGLELSRQTLPAALGSAPSLVALALLAPLALFLPEARAAGGPPGPPAGSPPPHARHAVSFALLWLAAFALPALPVAWYWSAYFYTTAAVGGALLVARAAARLSRWGFVALALACLWWHAASCAAPAFAVETSPWTWVSHWTPWYFERAASLSGELRAALRRAVPAPERGTRFFLTTLPPWAGFQGGNGAAIRDLYRDPSLESFFYTQYSDSAADGHPCEFLFWNGVAFERLYAGARDRFFQVGTDLLILGHPPGAVDAFRRALAGREPRLDVAYWLGWALLWSGERGGAERAWQAFGARDDTTAYRASLVAAWSALGQRDTVTARRRLLDAVRAGIGRPEAHALLGGVLGDRSTKFALLETQVAARLDPRDPWTRRNLFLALAAARLDEPAHGALAELLPAYPEWRSDSAVVRAARLLQDRAPGVRAGVFDKERRPLGAAGGGR